MCVTNVDLFVLEGDANKLIQGEEVNISLKLVKSFKEILSKEEEILKEDGFKITEWKTTSESGAPIVQFSLEKIEK